MEMIEDAEIGMDALSWFLFLKTLKKQHQIINWLQFSKASVVNGVFQARDREKRKTLLTCACYEGSALIDAKGGE